MARLINAEAQEIAELAPLLADGGRLSRGRQYHRKGNVADVDVGPGLVSASVQGSESEPYTVLIACREASENERAALDTDVTAVVPRPLDIAFTCHCADWGDPCKHGVAALLELAREVDDNPNLLLLWRGIEGVVPPPPIGTESLVEPTPEAGRPQPAAHAGQRPGSSTPPIAVRSTWGVDEDASDREIAETDETDAHAEGEVESSALDAFFNGVMPDDVRQLLGPLEQMQLDAYARVHLMVENVDAAPVLASAIDAVADHWLSR
jgi:hypothetical protein